MNDTRHNEHCKSLRAARRGFWASVRQRFSERCLDHVAHCPRCQKRLAAMQRVELSLCLMRTQPHTMELLGKANTSALKYLTRTSRQTACAEQLRCATHQPHRLEKASPMLERLINVAACLFVVLMIRVGLTNKMFQIKEQGTKVMENYYARNLDPQLFEDVFGQSPDLKA